MNLFYPSLFSSANKATKFGKKITPLILLSGLIFLTSLNSISGQTCNYSINLFDSFGDGWNGSILNVSVGGISTDYTITGGGSASFDIEAYINDVLTFTYSPGGFEGEVTYEILDSDGVVVFSDGPNPTVGVVFQANACSTCPAPLTFSLDAATSTSADVSWEVIDSAVSYNVEFGPVGFAFGTGTISNTTNASTSFSGLTQNSIYEVYLQTNCSNGQSGGISGPFSFQTTFDNPCDYTIKLYDSFGDGWNGSILNVSVGGIGTDYTIPPGGDSSTYIIPAGSNLPLVFTYTAGSFQNEVTYNILDPNGNILFSDGPNPTEGVVYETFACPTCPGALNLTVDDIFGLSADVSWIDSDSAGVYVVEYGETGFLPGDGSTFTTSDANGMILGLMEQTTYDFYVMKFCDNGDSSALAGPQTFTTIALNDVGIAGVDSPVTGCGLGLETLMVNMQNYGSNPQSLIPFYYSVNGNPIPINVPLDGYYTNVIGKDSMEMLEFEATYDFSQPGVYEIAVWTELENDFDTSNDTFYYTITSIPTIPDFPYAQNFETGIGGWAVSDSSVNATWDFGQPAGVNISNAASGENAWVTDLSGNYNNNELSYVVSNCFDFSTLTADPSISFSISYDTETSYDGGWLEFTTDGGQTWTKLGSMDSGINWYNFNNTNTDLGDVWAGDSEGWIFAKHPLIGMAGEPSVRFRFAFDSDGSVNGFDGMGIDDVSIFIPVANDLAAQSVVNVTTLACGDPNDQVTITIVNNGTAVQTGFDVGYQIGNGTPIIENVGALINLAPDESVQYTFTTPFNSGIEGTINITAWTDLSSELNVSNDTTIYEFETFRKTPLREDFELGNVVPQGWTTDGVVGNGHNNVSNVIFRNLFSSVQSFEVVSPPIGPILAGDTMTFDYRFTNWSAGTVGTVLGSSNSLELQASIDCGMTYTTLVTIDESNHVVSAEMATVEVDISSFEGQSVRFRWLTNWGSGDYWIDIDNINLWQCASLDLVADITDESFQGLNDGEVTIVPGSSAGPYIYVWSNGNLSETATGLSPGTYTVGVVDAFGCVDEIEFTVNAGLVNTNEIEVLKKITLAPNPTADIAVLDMEFSETVDLQVQVVNMMGQILFETFKDNTIEERIDLNMIDYASGMYFVRVSVNNETVVKKLMKGGN